MIQDMTVPKILTSAVKYEWKSVNYLSKDGSLHQVLINDTQRYNIFKEK